MPVTVTFTAYFGSDAGRGWSESHKKFYGDTPGDLLPLMNAFKSLMDGFRRPLLASDRYLKGLKVSYPSADRGIASSAYRYQPRSYPTNTKKGCAPSLAAQARFGDVTNTQFSNSFLRGFWDNVEQNEELDFTTADGAAWKALFDMYSLALVESGYGWDALDSVFTVRGEVVGYTVGVDRLVTFEVKRTAGGVMPAAGTLVSFRAARINNSSSVLNRTFQARVVDATHVVTLQPIAAGPFTSEGTFVIEYKTFARYTGVQYVVLARKSEGRPTNNSPARRKARARV